MKAHPQTAAAGNPTKNRQTKRSAEFAARATHPKVAAAGARCGFRKVAGDIPLFRLCSRQPDSAALLAYIVSQVEEAPQTFSYWSSTETSRASATHPALQISRKQKKFFASDAPLLLGSTDGTKLCDFATGLSISSCRCEVVDARSRSAALASAIRLRSLSLRTNTLTWLRRSR